MGWEAAVTNLAGVVTGQAPFEGLKLTRKLNGSTRVTFEVDALDESIAEADVASHAIKLYDSLDLRFFGKIDDPLVEGPERASINALDPFGWLERRRIQAVASPTGVLLARTFAQVDAGEIAWTLIDEQSARGATRIRQGSITPSVLRDRSYEPGKPVAEAIVELAEVDNGFYFRIDPVDDVAGTMADFFVLYPSSGTDRPDVKFEYGDGTIDNLDGFSRTRTRPANVATTRGTSSGLEEESGVALQEQASDADSIAAYDLIDVEELTSASESSTLASHAAGLLRPFPRSVYTFDPSARAAGETPRLFADFDVGDTCRLTIKHGRIDESELPVRVTEATLEVADSNSSDRLTGIVFEAV